MFGIVFVELLTGVCFFQNPMDPRSIKVYDFGLATVLDAQTPEISDGFAPGTPGYMAPEISLGQSYGIEVDMFSTGAVIFFLLSGYRPFVHQNRATVRRRTINCEYSMDQESWNRVSSEAQMLVRGLLVHREYPRLSAEDAICHPWLTGDEITLAHQESRDLSPNAMGVEVGVTSTETRNTQLVLVSEKDGAMESHGAFILFLTCTHCSANSTCSCRG
jgi:serine/threonine protein kinase